MTFHLNSSGQSEWRPGSSYSNSDAYRNATEIRCPGCMVILTDQEFRMGACIRCMKNSKNLNSAEQSGYRPAVQVDLRQILDRDQAIQEHRKALAQAETERLPKPALVNWPVVGVTMGLLALWSALVLGGLKVWQWVQS